MDQKIIENDNEVITEVKNMTPEGLVQESNVKMDKDQITSTVY